MAVCRKSTGKMINGVVTLSARRCRAAGLPGQANSHGVAFRCGIVLSLSAGFCMLTFALPLPVLAAHPHGYPDGTMIHQLSHALFIFSMGALIYHLHARGLGARPGWREIRFAAACLIMWSIIVFIMRLLEKQAGWMPAEMAGGRGIQPETVMGGDGLAAWLHLFVRFDYLLFLPGLFFLYRGLSRFSASGEATAGDNGGGGA